LIHGITMKWLVIKNCKSNLLTKWLLIQIASQTHSQRLKSQPQRLLICILFSQNTSHSHDNLRRVSKSPLLHLFTHHRSGTLDWCVMRATSADSSRLIHSILAHSSTLHYCSIFCHHRTSGWSVATEVACFVMSCMMRCWIMQSERNLELALLF
jgi:hypothetical protein